jgi:hypothetical protein
MAEESTILVGDAHWYVRAKKGKGCVALGKSKETDLPEDRLYPSVTTVLSKGFPCHFAFHKYLGDKPSFDLAEEYKMKRAKIGTCCHDALEWMAKNPGKKLQRNEYGSEEWSLISSGVKWHSDFSVQVLATEDVIYDDTDHTAGTSDLYCRIFPGTPSEELVVVDYKTSKQINDEHKVQVFKYARMRHLMGQQVDAVAILRLAPGRSEGYEFWKKPYVYGDKTEEEFAEAFKAARFFFFYLPPKPKPTWLTVRETLSL